MKVFETETPHLRHPPGVGASVKERDAYALWCHEQYMKKVDEDRQVRLQLVYDTPTDVFLDRLKMETWELRAVACW